MTVTNQERIARLFSEGLIRPSWKNIIDKALEIFFNDILPELKKEDDKVFPEPDRLFHAFNTCRFDELKVVIIGQDPYHNGRANGLAFDNTFKYTTKVVEENGVETTLIEYTPIKPSPSLANIIKEMENDLGEEYTERWASNDRVGSWLGHLPEQGVLLLNTALTVARANPTSHSKLWVKFTEEIVKSIQSKDNIIWILWGSHAQQYKSLITNKTHHIIEGVHPSPFSANRGFFGSRPFSRTNTILKSLNTKTIDW